MTQSRHSRLKFAAGGFRDFAVVGMLASYGASLSDLYRRKAKFIDQILRGANPASRRSLNFWSKRLASRSLRQCSRWQMSWST